MNQSIATIEKNKKEEIRVDLIEFKGYNLIGIRVYTEMEGKPEKVPTKKGITCNVKLLPDLIQALTEAERLARKEELVK